MKNKTIDSGTVISLDNRVNLGLAAWLAMFCSILIWNQSNLRVGELGDSNNYYRILLVLFAAVASAIALVSNYRRWSQAFPAPLLLLLVYGLVALCSSVFIPSHAFYSMWKSFEILVDVLVIAALLSYQNQQNVARAAYRMLAFLYGLLIVIYLLEALTVPTLAFQESRGYLSVYMLGVMPVMTQNALAFSSAVCAFAIVCRLHRPGHTGIKLAYVLMLVLALLTLILAQSRTSVVGLVLALVVYLLFDRRYASLCIVIVLNLAGTFFTDLYDTSYQYLLRGQDPQLVITLSGRTEGWEKAWQAFLESPIAGQGFAAFARANILGTTGMSSMHGAVFDVLVGTGLLGFIPWAAAIIWTFLRLVRLPLSGHASFASVAGRSIQAEMIGVAVLILVRASTSSGLALHQDNFMLFLTVLAYATSMRHAVTSQGEEPSTASVTALASRLQLPLRPAKVREALNKFEF
jgi:O-antigen ligase